MAFEVFNRRSAGRTREPAITIQKRGTFSFNAPAAQMIAGDDNPHQLPVELLFDAERQIVGFRKARNATNPYMIRKQQNSESYLLTGRAFTQHYQIDTSVARRYRANIYEGIVGLCLTDEAVEVGRGRPPNPVEGAANATLSDAPGGSSQDDLRKLFGAEAEGGGTGQATGS
ncbi:MAG: hypothetical protein MJB57_05735 [Gemmatimonadetes bacterium]|nr:hypothetical protein [Gemmatimonadota bacterium]